jgi:hypothetical protein
MLTAEARVRSEKRAGIFILLVDVDVVVVYV